VTTLFVDPDTGRVDNSLPDGFAWPECCTRDTECSLCGFPLCSENACAPEPTVCLEAGGETVHCGECQDECMGCRAELRAEAGCPR